MFKLEKIKSSVDKFNKSLQSIDKRIVDLDENFYSVKMWIETESHLEAYLDMTTLYGKYSNLLGLESAKKRLKKTSKITDSYIEEALKKTEMFKRKTPFDINQAILTYLEARIDLKNKKKKLKDKPNLFKRFYKNLDLKKV